MRLIKTIGGNNGAPSKCHKCGSKEFLASGVAWHCGTCGTYYPTALGFDNIKKLLEKAQAMSKYEKEFKRSKA